ncbi:MAG: hypothetical protein JW900_14260 [Anaerolineae bacterium]|nr:hypothetical protein [Anaerolineae bacterium]
MKLKRPDANKVRQPAANKGQEAGGAELRRMSEQVQEALKLLDSEAADQIIGEQGAEYRK